MSRPSTTKVINELKPNNLNSLLEQSVGSVSVSNFQGNPFQPDVNYRGFTASPLLGTPQGLSVYLDNVRMNQPFGDVVSWDLIPINAISRVDIDPGIEPPVRPQHARRRHRAAHQGRLPRSRRLRRGIGRILGQVEHVGRNGWERRHARRLRQRQLLPGGRLARFFAHEGGPALRQGKPAHGAHGPRPFARLRQVEHDRQRWNAGQPPASRATARSSPCRTRRRTR